MMLKYIELLLINLNLLIEKGVFIEDAGNEDLFGNKLKQLRTIGVHEYTESN